MVAAFKANLDIYEAGNDEEAGEEMVEPCTWDEAEDYMDCELEHEFEFSSLNRIACFLHNKI